MAAPASNNSRDSLQYARERLVRAFLCELRDQLTGVGQSWQRFAKGEPEKPGCMVGRLRRLAEEADMLQLEAHGHLLAALADVTRCALGRLQPIPQGLTAAIQQTLDLCASLEPHERARAEAEAAQLRWLCRHADGSDSGVFAKEPADGPRRLDQ